MEQAQKEGKINHIGFSFHDTLPVLKEIVDYYPWDVVQVQYNYMDTGIQATTEGVKYIHEKGMALEDQMEEERFHRLREIFKMFNNADILPLHENCMNYGGMGWQFTFTRNQMEYRCQDCNLSWKELDDG